jgi:phosphopantetheine--protein transferase-like protein
MKEIQGVGADVASIDRYRNQAKLAKRVLSPREFLAYTHAACPEEFLASRFAVKESYVKASGDKKVDYRTLEVKKERDGKPFLCRDGHRLPAFVSLAHDGVAFAIVILYGKTEKEKKTNPKSPRSKR